MCGNWDWMVIHARPMHLWCLLCQGRKKPGLRWACSEVHGKATVEEGDQGHKFSLAGGTRNKRKRYSLHLIVLLRVGRMVDIRVVRHRANLPVLHLLYIRSTVHN